VRKGEESSFTMQKSDKPYINQTVKVNISSDKPC
jgi:hypothetical protein